MAAQVLSFFQRSPRLAPIPADWSQQELAEFYRVEAALMRAGIRVGTDRGMSDENEPWFVFYRADDGEVVIHFARIDGEYLIAGPAYEEIARGFDFTALVRNMVARHPLIRRSDNNSNLSVHPAALLVAVVGTAFFKTGEARAAESGATNSTSSHSRPVLLSSSSNAGLSSGVAPITLQQAQADSIQLPANQAVLILAAALMASNYQPESASVDPQTRAAIASAAAALDFSDAQTATTSTGDHGATIVGSPVGTYDNSAKQMVSSVLSLVALLSSMPQPSEPAAVTTAALGEVTLHRYGANDHTHALQAPDLSHWAIDVRLSQSDASVVEAVQLVRGVIGDVGFQKITVIEIAKLPDALAQIIAKGAHYGVTSPTPDGNGAPDIAPPTTPATPVTPVPDTGSSDPTPPPIIDTKPEPPTPKPPVYSGFASQELVRSFIDYFVAHTTAFEIVTHGREVVMLDSRVTKDPGAIADLTSMTFHFFDGSSISLVGDHSSFLHDGILV